MPKLLILSYKNVVKVLHKLGFKEAPKRGKGSHLAFVKRVGNKSYLVVVPRKTEIPRGTLLSIIDQAGLSKSDFMKLLHE